MNKTNSTNSTQDAKNMNTKWDVYVVDFVESTCEIVLASVPMDEAKDFQSAWKDGDSQVVILPDGFAITGGDDEHERKTAQNELHEVG